MGESLTQVFVIQNLGLLQAELLLALGAIALLMFGVFSSERAFTRVTGLSIAILVAAGILLFATPERGEAMNGAFVLDEFSRFMKLLTLLGSGLAMIMSVNYMKREGVTSFEYPVLMLVATLGMMVMISANNMIALYLGLELQSLCLYVIASINRESARSTEAGFKYFVLGALSSGVLLYGASLIYGYTGHTDFAGISEAMAGSGRSVGLIFGLIFLMAGILFKLSAVPFHMWTPDVYEGSPTPVTAFLAVAPKIAAMAMLVRVVVGAFEPVTPEWQQIIAFIAISSMVLGAFAMIGQSNIKRMMAYASISHMGYALTGLAAGTQAGVRGVIVYMLIYMVMTVGMFAFIIAMRRKDGAVEDIADLAGLSVRRPFTALALTLLVFSLAGIPPLAGFFARYFVFVAAIQAELYVLAVTGVLASVVAAGCYLRLIKVIWFDEAAENFVPMPGELRVVLLLSGIFVAFYAIIAGPVLQMTTTAAASFF